MSSLTMAILLLDIVLVGQLVNLFNIGQICNVLAFPLQDCQSNYIDLHLHSALRSNFDKRRLKNIVTLFLPAESNMTMKTRVEIFEHKLNGSVFHPIGYNDYKNGSDLIDKIDKLVVHNDSCLDDIKTAIEHSKYYFKENTNESFDKIKAVIVLTSKKSNYSHQRDGNDGILVHVIYLHKTTHSLRLNLNELSENEDFSTNNILSVDLCGDCRTGWFLIKSKEFHSCYLLEESDTLLNYESALKRCNRSNSTLLEVESEEEFHLIQQKLSETLMQRYSRITSIIFHIDNCDRDISKSMWYKLRLNKQTRKPQSMEKHASCVVMQLNKSNGIIEISLLQVDKEMRIANFFHCEKAVAIFPFTKRRKTARSIYYGAPWDLHTSNISQFNQRLISPSDAQNIELLQCTFVRTLEPYLMPFKELPYTFVCDGVANCEDARDERMCSKVEHNICNGEHFCAAFMPIRGPEEVCIKHDQMCDKVQNCPDNSDEEFCADCLEALTGDGVCLPSRWFQTKSVFDTFKRYPKIVLPNLDFTNCNDNECFFQNDTGKPLTVCSQESKETINSKGIQKYKYAAKCHYFLNRRNASLGCVDNSHLTNCEDFKCGPGFYKCNNSYCIPNAMRMNGVVNCPSEAGYQDEEDLEIHFYCLRDPNRFYSAGNLCDGRCDCGTGCDDEMLCHEKCPSGFMCLWGVTKLIDRNKVNYTNLFDTLDKNIKLFRASGLDLSSAYVPRYIRLDKILEIHLSNCSLHEKKMTEILLAMIDSLHNVYHLDLSYNTIRFEKFYDFSAFFVSLRILNLTHTSVSRMVILGLVTRHLQTIDLSCTPLESLNFFNFRSHLILYLNVSSTLIKTLGFFETIGSFGTVDMRNTNIVFDLKTSEHLQNIKIDNNIYGDSYKLCCENYKGSGIPSYACHAPSDAISSCENLLNDDVKRSLIWLVALIGCSGNAVVIGYRIFHEKHLLKQGYRMFVTNLGLSDFIMSVYLIIIAGADVYYRDDYVLYDIEWRDSSLCKAAGFLATLSTETSSLFVLLITIDRYVIFKNTLNTVHFTPKILIIVVALIWSTGIAISTIPILFPDWQVYSSNTMCLALPVNLTHPLGWIFSLLIYIIVNFVMMLMISFGQILIFKQIAMPSNSLINTSTHRRREITVAKNLSLIAVSNVLCWMPVCVIGLLSAAGYIFSPDVYGWLAVAIMPLNSAVNPILYTLPVAYNALNQSKTKPRKHLKRPDP